MKHRAIVVDDERLARVGLISMLQARGDVDVVAEADGLDAAIQALTSFDPDLVFLDIHMPPWSGFELFSRVDVRAHVVFVTAYSEHAVRAFEVDALDYLVKPIDPQDLDRVFRRLGEPHPQPSTNDRLSTQDIVLVRHAEGMRPILVANILYIESSGDYSLLHLAAGDTLISDTALRRWEERLSRDFVRAHRSILVNLHAVRDIRLEEGRWSLLLRDGDTRLPMSRRCALKLKRGSA